ncbi:MAG: hypothetical protein JXR96_07285 [Deltaproteobacteria bacterium]|nr:hypothetical protein [Deltaproteobacteria bacterium]
MRRAFRIAWLCVLLPCPAQAEFEIDLSAHGLLVDLAEWWGGGVDFELAAAWLPRPEFSLGLELGCMVPLRTGASDRQTEAAFRAIPELGLYFGNPESWGFVRLGAGIDGHLRAGSLSAACILTCTAGFCVAPSSLPFHFGFELCGDLGVAGETVRCLGLGGFLGWRL